MNPNFEDIAERIRTLREITGYTTEEMAVATGVSVSEYEALEQTSNDYSFTFLYRCAEKFGVDIIELITGETPKLTGYTVVRANQGLRIKRNEQFEYYHLAATFKNKLAEPFKVIAPYRPEEHSRPIELHSHEGQEFDFILKGVLRFAYGTHMEDLYPGDSVYYDSSKGHGMIAMGGEECVFLAVVMKEPD
ncbi:MAG: helix-turn-helix transcriptional regulator [Clostridiales bacterium]|jgi:transcriptional regulator with XRE-family HTH domain|nr:helix-turn-helix transcriptional regulator [Clostridiales bacterium]